MPLAETPGRRNERNESEDLPCERIYTRGYGSDSNDTVFLTVSIVFSLRPTVYPEYRNIPVEWLKSITYIFSARGGG